MLVYQRVAYEKPRCQCKSLRNVDTGINNFSDAPSVGRSVSISAHRTAPVLAIWEGKPAWILHLDSYVRQSKKCSEERNTQNLDLPFEPGAHHV